MAAGLQKLAQARRGVGDGVGAGHSDYVKAFALAVGDDETFRRRRVADQKSRSA
jgi:hypothetical protein